MLVIGANGHLGRALLCTPGGWPARALVRSARAEAQLRALPPQWQPQIHRAPRLDAESLAQAGAGCAGFVHLAGILRETRRARYRDAHERIAEAVARAAERCGVRRIVWIGILGAAEDSPNACLASKARAEAILRGGATPVTALRVPMVLGPGELAAAALRRRARARVALLPRGGASLEQPLDARDLIAAIRAALADRSAQSHSLDLAGPESLPRRALLARAARALGQSPPRILPLPLGALRLFAALAERLAEPPLTRAMLGVLEHDDCVDPQPALRRLGIALHSLDETLRASLGASPAERAA